MNKLLGDSEVRRMLAGLKGWEREGDFIVRSFEFEAFMDGMRFLNRVAKVAERLDHHPDIHVRYTQIKLSIQTHSAGGLTAKDFGLAAEIDRIPL